MASSPAPANFNTVHDIAFVHGEPRIGNTSLAYTVSVRTVLVSAYVFLPEYI